MDLVQFPYIKIKFNSKAHFCEYKNKWDILTDFLTFGMGKAVYPLNITGYTDLGKRIEIFYNVNSIISPIEDISWDEILFLYSDISDLFENCLNNWYNNAEKFGPVYNLYVGTHRKPSMFAEHRFLSYIQAIEAYHSRKCPKKSKKNKRWFLRERLESIFLENGDFFEILIDDSDKFIDDIVNTRNYYTHYSKYLEKKAIIDINQFVILTEKLRFIIEVCLLLELGINKEKIREIIARNKEYKVLKDRLNNQISKRCGVHMGYLLLEKLLSKILINNLSFRDFINVLSKILLKNRIKISQNP